MTPSPLREIWPRRDAPLPRGARKAMLKTFGIVTFVALAIALTYWALTGRYVRTIGPADIVGTWASVEHPACTFTFRTDGTLTFKNVPVSLFEGLFDLDPANRHFGPSWRPPHLNKTGEWRITQPLVGDRFGKIEFVYPGGGAPPFFVANDRDGLTLLIFVGDPDSNDTVAFRRK